MKMLPNIRFIFERWKWNDEYELWVSTEGHIRDRYKQEVQVFINQKGYMRVYSEAKKKGVSVHRLVLLTWRPRVDADLLTVEHCDSNKRNNTLRNLLWMTEDENLKRAQEKNIYEKELVPTPSKKILANGVAMTIEDAVTFIYALPSTSAQFSKKQVEEKIKETLNNNKLKKQVFGITLQEVEG